MPESRFVFRTSRILLANAFSALLLFSGAATAAPEAGRSAVFVMGPAAGDTGGQAARSAAFACRRWLKEPGATAELRRAGSSESVALDKAKTAKDLDSLFETAAKDAVDRDPAELISTLDDAVHALANRSGMRVAVAVLDVASLAGETEESFRQIIQFAADNSVHIVLLDPSKASMDAAGGIWKQAGSNTGGAFIQDSKTLASSMLLVSGLKPTAADIGPALPPPTVAKAKVNAKSDLSTDLPVYTRFIQISNRSSGSQSLTAQTGESNGFGVSGNFSESASRVEGAGGPLHGYVIVQAPLSALHFDKDDRTGSYSGHTIVNVVVRNAAGKDAWHASKDIKITGPLAKFHEREGGNLYLLREVQLPGGQYTIEASVQDLLATKTSNISEPLKTGSGVPGLMVSDAMFVKPLKGSVDKYEADSTIDYQGNALAPMLGPVFPANTPFNVDVFFILYPDVYGSPPQITMEILQEGKVVSKAEMPFKTMLRNSAQEGRGTELHGALQHGFDYMATMKVDKMSASDCQARLTIRQGKNMVTRLVDFRIADSGNVAQKAAEPKPAN